MADTRQKAFLESFGRALHEGAENGWSKEELNDALVKAAREHGYWMPGIEPTVGASAGMKGFSVGGAVNAETMEPSVEVGVPKIGGARTSIEPTDAPVKVTPIVQSQHFAEVAPFSDNKFRIGDKYTLSVEGGPVSVSGAFSFATDGTIAASLQGHVGKVVTLDAGATLPIIDTKHVVDMYKPALEETIKACGPGAAEEVVRNVLDDNGGGGWVPKSQLTFAAAVSEHTVSGKEDFTHGAGDVGAAGGQYTGFKLKEVEGNPGYYRVTGSHTPDAPDNATGSMTVREFDGIINSSGKVLAGYMTEYKDGRHVANGRATGPDMASKNYGYTEEWNGDFTQSLPRAGSQNVSDDVKVERRKEAVEEGRERIDAMERTDLARLDGRANAPIDHFKLTPGQVDNGIRSDASTETVSDIAKRIAQAAPAARAEIAAKSADGTITLDEATTGKMLSQTGTGQMIADLDAAGVKSITVPTPISGSSTDHVRSMIEGVARAHKEAGLPQPESEYRPDLDATGVTNEDVAAATGVEAKHGTMTADIFLQKRLEDRKAEAEAEKETDVDLNRDTAPAGEYTPPQREDAGLEMEGAF